MKLNVKPLALLCFATCAGTAAAANLQGPLSFDKTQYFKGDTATVTIKGKGECKNLEISWGDDSKDTIGNFSFGPTVGAKNLSKSHPYNTAGTFNVEVKSVGGGNPCAAVAGSLSVATKGALKNIQLNKSSITAGQEINVTIVGEGVCGEQTQLRGTRSGVPPSFPKVFYFGPVFAKDANWPRVATFAVPKMGIYTFDLVKPGGMPTLGDGCMGQGSPSNPLNVAQTGGLSGIFPNKKTVQKGESVIVSINGWGTCPTGIRITSKVNGVSGPSFETVFAKDALWPRTLNTGPLSMEGKWEFGTKSVTPDANADDAICTGWGDGVANVVTVGPATKIQPIPFKIKP